MYVHKSNIVFHLIVSLHIFSASGHLFKKKSYWNAVHGIFNEWGTVFDLFFLASYKVGIYDC